MPRTTLLERKSTVRVLGAAFIALAVLVVWVTYAFFNKSFVNYDDVIIRTQKTGVNLPQNADIKLKGMIVGEVRKVEPDGDGVKITLGMNPKLIDNVPRDVSAQILPKTLFGEKYIALIPPASGGSGAKLKAGDEIKQTTVPIEVEELLNDSYPLLTAVDPANLSYTLTALSDALSGRGKQLGDTLVTFNRYFKEVNPDVPQLVADLIALGTVADGYADAMPDIGRLLSNAVVTGDTILAKRAQLSAFFAEGTRLANTLTAFTQKNAKTIPELAKGSQPALEVLSDYADTFPCFLGAMRQVIPRLDSAFRDRILHINLKVIPQPTPYQPDEALKATRADFDAASVDPPAKNGKDITARNAASGSCLDLNTLIAKAKDPSTTTGYWMNNTLSSQKHPFTVPPAVYKLVSIKRDHGKFGSASDFERVAPTSASSVATAVQPSMGGVDTAEERELMNVFLGASTGVQPQDVPDLGSLLLGPVLRGAEVEVK